MTAKSPTSDIAFTPTVKALQEAHGSRKSYAQLEERGGFRTEIDEGFEEFIAGIDTAYLATANAHGQPYAQHRGGPKGFIRRVGPRTLAFAEYAGNQQFITIGNLADNDQAFLFLMDYAYKRRIKVWGRARVSNDPEVVAQLMPKTYPVKGERAILFDVAAWDINCPQHIPQKIDLAEVAGAMAHLNARIAELETEIAAVRAQLAGAWSGLQN